MHNEDNPSDQTSIVYAQWKQSLVQQEQLMHNENNPSDPTIILDKHTARVHICTLLVYLSNMCVVSEGLCSVQLYA